MTATPITLAWIQVAMPRRGAMCLLRPGKFADDKRLDAGTSPADDTHESKPRGLITFFYVVASDAHGKESRPPKRFAISRERGVEASTANKRTARLPCDFVARPWAFCYIEYVNNLNRLSGNR